MRTKDQLRKKFLTLRKKKYFDVSKSKFYQLCVFVKKRFKSKKKIVVALYYPSNYEIDILKIKNIFDSTKFKYLLPRIQDNNLLKFVEWNDRDILLVNKYGIPEPLNTQKNYLPDIVLVPLLAFDKEKNRLGYVKGFYDRYLNKLIKSNKKILAIGVAFSFQKYKKIPSSKFDFQLNKVFTEKGFI